MSPEPNSDTQATGMPQKQGLYDPQFEHDACGVGFVVNIKGKKSHQIVRDALTILINLNHRGACGCEANTGDGAGILMQMPHEFLVQVCAKIPMTLPEPGQYGSGIVFLPRSEKARKRCETLFEKIIVEEGQTVLGWRDVPTKNSALGKTAQKSEPFMRQIFIGRNPAITDDMAFERKLFVIRKRAEHAIRYGKGSGKGVFYVPSLSYKTIVYKGMLLTEQMDDYYPELKDPAMQSALALVHSRFSTNTFPSWDRAHPYRYIAHNGEINALRGNINWMHARQAMFASQLFGDDIKKLLPIINTDGSDSAMFDNCLEMLVLSGRSLPHAVMMMVPEPWNNHETMSDDKKAFYEYHSCLMEPWDGPASIAFSDGKMIGACLDRNGLRPSRYYVTKDDMVIMASEVGVLDVEPENVVEKGRLQPGRMFLINTDEGRIVSDEEIKSKIIGEKPYRQWLNDNLTQLTNIPDPVVAPENPSTTVTQRQKAFGYTFEDLKIVMTPMARDGVEAVGAMGADTPLAVLSEKSQLLYNYFKQLFAQVTNPPIDCIREEIVTSAVSTIGSERNLLEPTPESCKLIEIKTPVLTNEELNKFKHINVPGYKSATIPSLFKASEGEAAMTQAMDEIYAQASKAIADGANILILSDRGVNKDFAPIPALLAVAGVHHHLIREGTRTRVGIILETGEPREIHHYALLIGYGAGAINPYMAFESIDEMIRMGLLPNTDHKTAVKNYVKAAVKGVVKVTSKMGISTIQSYRGAQIFEAVGLNASVIDKYFTGTVSPVGGIDINVIAKEVLLRHQKAFPDREVANQELDSGGYYQWRKDGEKHLFNPESIHLLQLSTRQGDYNLYKSYAKSINDQSKEACTLRGLLDFKFAPTPISIDEVESVDSIVKRFKTGAMSFGSISQEAHEALAIAMNRLGGKSNTGEGGEDPSRFVPLPNGDSLNSAIKQVASGRFGVTSHYLVNAKEIQIKMAQGAKPGEGGQLPGGKVYPWVAKVRHSTPGVGLISPPPHHDIYSIEDLAELIHDLKNANQEARISVKLVSEAGVGTIAAGVAKAHADVVLISGFDGGTGASPQTSIKNAGLPWELGLAETHQTLLLNNLRSRIVVETDGQLKTGRDVVIAALLGAEEFGFATAPLVVLGCIMMRVCNLNTCSAGIATQDPRLRKNFKGDPAHVVNFMKFVAQEAREIMAQLGIRTLNELVGRTDLLESKNALDHWKQRGLDFTAILHQPKVPTSVGRYCKMKQDHGLDKAMDNTILLPLCKPALETKKRIRAQLPICNVNRVVGTILGSEISRRYGAEGLPEDTIQILFKGSAGQSFGAFMPKGMTWMLEGDANDYLGKGLSGGKIIVYPPEGSTFVPEENIITGNVAFYGATAGEAYIRGMAGERFCVRNSGVNAVVESVGDHGCEYMTGGRVVILGKTGRNFAAGMSGGIAYVLDEAGDFKIRCNQQMVSLEAFENEAESEEVRQMIEKHVKYTKSQRGAAILANWSTSASKFVKVIPKDYKRMLAAIARVKAEGLSGEDAVMAAFEANSRDISRVGGG